MSGGASFTFTGASLGSASPDRVIYVFFAGFGGPTPAANPVVTINGITATLITRNSGNAKGFLYKANVPSGTSATLIFNWSGASLSSLFFSAYAVKGSIGVLEANNSIPATTTSNIPMNVVQNGWIIGASAYPSADNITWTGLTFDAGEWDWVDRHMDTASRKFTVAGVVNINSRAGSQPPHTQILASIY